MRLLNQENVIAESNATVIVNVSEREILRSRGASTADNDYKGR
jgi:hypothetical protein